MRDSGGSRENPGVTVIHRGATSQQPSDLQEVPHSLECVLVTVSAGDVGTRADPEAGG